MHATLTDTWIEGSRALGAETTSATAAPGEVQVVPGVAFGGGPTAVRVAVPGDQDAVVRVSVFGPRGLVPTTGESVLSVVAGGVGQLEVRGVPAGTHAVVLRADVPVVASVLSRTVASSAASTQAEGTPATRPRRGTSRGRRPSRGSRQRCRTTRRRRWQQQRSTPLARWTAPCTSSPSAGTARSRC